MGTTEILARHIVETTYDSLPAEVVRAAKDVILDGVGVMLAGSQEEPPRIVAEYAREMGGLPQCTVFGLGLRTSPPMAAFVNGVSGQAPSGTYVGVLDAALKNYRPNLGFDYGGRLVAAWLDR